MNSVSNIPAFTAITMPVQTLMFIGVVAGVIIISIAYANWRRAVKMAFIILLFEGAMRKWVFSSAQELVYFLKDVVLLGAYLRFYLSPGPEIRSKPLVVPRVMIFICCFCVGMSAFNPNIGSFVLAVYGLKIYLYYVPLAFMIPYLWRSQQEMVRNLTWYALMGIPICILGLIQSRAGLDSALNVYASQDHGTSFGGAEGVRVTGTFSYITGHTTFVVFFTALHVALLMGDLKKFYWWMLMLDLPLLLGNAFMGGSRASVFCMALVVGGFVASSFFTKMSRGKPVIFVLGLGSVVAALGVMIFFADARDRWTMRYRGASAAGDTLTQRVLEHPLWSIEYAVKYGGFAGYGIGTTHPATEAMRRVLGIPMPRITPPGYDMEVSQVTVELGIIGVFGWYVLRFFMTWQTFRSLARCPPGSFRSLLLAALLVEIPFMFMSVVLNHTANFLVFACFGLALIPQVRSAVPRGVLGRGQRGSSVLPRSELARRSVGR